MERSEESKNTITQTDEVNFKQYSQNIRNYYILDYLKNEDRCIVKNERTRVGNLKLKTDLIQYAKEKMKDEKYELTIDSIQGLLLNFPEEYQSTLKWILKSFMKDMVLLANEPFIQIPYSFNEQVQSYLVIHFVILFKSKYKEYTKQKKNPSKKEIRKMIRDSFSGWLDTCFKNAFLSYYDLISFIPFLREKGAALLMLDKYHYKSLCQKMGMLKYHFQTFNFCFKTLPSTKENWDKEAFKISFLLYLFFKVKDRSWFQYKLTLNTFNLSKADFQCIYLVKEREKEDFLAKAFQLIRINRIYNEFNQIKNYKGTFKNNDNSQLMSPKKMNDEKAKTNIEIKSDEADGNQIAENSQLTMDEKITLLLKQVNTQQGQIADLVKSKQTQQDEIADLVKSKQTQQDEIADLVKSKQTQQNEISDLMKTKMIHNNQLRDLKMNVQDLQDTISGIQLRDYAKRSFFYFGDMFQVYGYTEFKFNQLIKKINTTLWNETCKRNVIVFLNNIYIFLHSYNAYSHTFEGNPIEGIKSFFDSPFSNQQSFSTIFDKFLTINSFQKYFYNKYDESITFSDFYNAFK